MTAYDDLLGFWMFMYAYAQARYIEWLELKAFCERNENRRLRAAREG